MPKAEATEYTGGHDMKLSHRLDVSRAKRRRRRFTAPVVAVTGSSGKTTTSSLLAHVLEGHGKVGRQVLENGVLSIAWRFLKMPLDVDHIVVETGVAKPGDMDGLVELVKPDVAVVTLVAAEHYKAFRGEAAVAEEKGKLVAALPQDGLAVLNGDDARVMEMARRTGARIVRFGRSPDCEYRYRVLDLTLSEGLSLVLETPAGQLVLRTTARADFLAPCFAAAAAVALELGVPSDIVRARMASFPPVRERFEYRRLAGGPHLIIDTAKAPEHSLHNLLVAFGALDAGRRRVVLGQISDSRGKSRTVYRRAIDVALSVADEVVLVGENATRVGRKHPETDRLKIVETPREVAQYLRDTVRKDDLILLKSSRILHLERLALALEQDLKCWKPECEIKFSCVACGLYGDAPEHHKAIRRRKEFGKALGPLQRLLPPKGTR